MTEFTTVRRNLLFISRSSPYGSSRARACLDMVLSAAVFDQHVTLLFMDDGVLQLQRGQTANRIQAKDLSAALTALPLYDVNRIYVEEASLHLRGLASQQLVIDAIPCDGDQIAQLIRQADGVFTL